MRPDLQQVLQLYFLTVWTGVLTPHKMQCDHYFKEVTSPAKLTFGCALKSSRAVSHKAAGRMPAPRQCTLRGSLLTKLLACPKVTCTLPGLVATDRYWDKLILALSSLFWWVWGWARKALTPISSSLPKSCAQSLLDWRVTAQTAVLAAASEPGYQNSWQYPNKDTMSSPNPYSLYSVLFNSGAYCVRLGAASTRWRCWHHHGIILQRCHIYFL